MCNSSWDLDFSYDYYREILFLLKKDFYLCSFFESPRYTGKQLDRPVAVLRHDIDLDIDKALIMAEIESNMGVCSCFMFLTNCAFYSIEDDTVSSAIRSIKEMGHDIGIHYDIHQDKNSTIEIECSRLEDILNSVVKSISFHRPISEYLNGPIYIGDRVNTYASDLMNNYLSDSKGIWREGEPLTARLERSVYPMVLVTQLEVAINQIRYQSILSSTSIDKSAQCDATLYYA